MKDKKIRICPKCGSIKFKVVGGISSAHNRCERCEEIFRMEDLPEIELKDYKEVSKKLNKVTKKGKVENPDFRSVK